MLALLTLVFLAQAQVNHVPLKTDGTTIENYMDDKGSHFYKIKIGDDYNGKEDLVISIAPKDSKSDPDIHISTTNEQPSTMQDSEFSCAMVGEDICTIPSSDIKVGKVFYIGAKCYRKCSYAISASLLSEIELLGRKDYRIPVKAGEKKIFTFKNPHPGIKNLLFTARADRSTVSMRMYIKEGADGTPTSSDMRSDDGWEDGIVIRLSDKTLVKLKDDQTYKLLLEVDDSATITMRVDIIYSEKLIEAGEAYEDFVNYGEKTCYKYIVKSADKKLRIGAYSFSGNPDIYVNPGSNPANLEEYAFKANEPSDDVLVLTPEDREKKDAKKGLYYICIVGHSNTSYRLRVAESDQDFYLEDGIAETNELQVGKETTFYYTDASLVRNLNLTFTLSVKSGPKPDMYVKFCGRISEDQCVIGSKTAEGVIKATSDANTVYSFIQHEGASCKKKAEDQNNACTYVVEVVSPRSDYSNDITHFSIVAHHNETSHIKLREGVSLEQIVENHQVRYFEFVVRDSLATNITFTVNSHHGDADIYVSRTEKYPDATHYEKKSARSRRFADEVLYDKEVNKTLQGVYYIAVQGFEYSSYSIRATISRGNDTDKLVPTQLSEGVVLNEFLSGPKEKKYYQFKTFMFGNSISDIRVSVTPVIGEYNVYVKSGGFPTETDYDYKSENGSEITIKTTDKNFEAVGMKYVLVVPNTKIGGDVTDYRYSIKYTTARSISALRKEIPSFGTVPIGAFNYYKYTSIDKGGDLTISLTPLSGDPNLVVSIDPRFPYPNKEVNDFHSKKIGMDSVNITGDKLFQSNPTCKPSEQPLLGGKPCEIYIGVYCSDTTGAPESRKNDSCSYSVKIYSDYSFPHMLIDGVPQKDAVKDKKYLYYFVPIQTQRDRLYIAANTEKGDIDIFVSFADQSEKNEKLVMPNDQSHIKRSKGSGHSEVVHFGRKQLLKECGEFKECMALIAVRGMEPVEYNEFTLIAYTHIPALVVNTPMVGKIEEDSMIYYRYRSSCEDCTIIISASSYSVDTDIDLYINYGWKKELPTKDAHDIKVNNWFSEHIELDLEHPFMTKNKIKSMKEIFIIGVYAKEETTISIEIEESKSRIKQVKDGKSVKIEQEPNDVMYFKYEHKEHTNIKFEVTAFSGSVNMRVNKYSYHENDQPEHKFLPKDDRSAIWSEHSKQNSTIKISTEDDDYCDN